MKKIIVILAALLIVCTAGPVQIMAAEEGSTENDVITEVLDALDNQTYKDTMAALQAGEVIKSGTVSDAAAGMQQTLVDMGCDIDVDGSAGPATFGALNNTLEVLDIPEVTEVNAEVYEQLLELCLITSDEEAARDILYDSYNTEEGNRFDYLRGLALYAQEKYYSAKEAFLASEYGDYQERADQCEQPWPQNGELWHNGSYYSEAMYLTFKVNSYDESEGMYFEVYAENGDMVSTLFLTGSGSVTTFLPGGVYKIKDAAGKAWYGMKDVFGKEGSYEFMSFYEYDSDPYLTLLEAGYEWTITVNVSQGTTDGTGVGTTETDWENWTKR